MSREPIAVAYCRYLQDGAVILMSLGILFVYSLLSINYQLGRLDMWQLIPYSKNNHLYAPRETISTREGNARHIPIQNHFNLAHNSPEFGFNILVLTPIPYNNAQGKLKSSRLTN